MIREINKNFVIRYKFDDDKKTSLIGAGRYATLIEDEELAKKHFNKALNSGLKNITFKLRRGLKIDFVGK